MGSAFFFHSIHRYRTKWCIKKQILTCSVTAILEFDVHTLCASADDEDHHNFELAATPSVLGRKKGASPPCVTHRVDASDDADASFHPSSGSLQRLLYPYTSTVEARVTGTLRSPSPSDFIVLVAATAVLIARRARQ